ncbi:MAG: hypothetical protein ACI4XW_12405 [Candidatus Spyradocola sp.]
MKWGWRVLALGLLIAAILAAPIAARTAVVDVKQRLRPDTPAWEGVVSVGVVPSFPTVNLSGWLNAAFRRFEAQNSGVLVSLREITETGVRAGAAAGTLPDALLFGMTVPLGAEDVLQPMTGKPDVRGDLQGAGVWGGERYALPVAMGGYALLGNRRLLDAAGWSPSLGFDGTMALLADKNLAIAAPNMPYTDPLRALTAMGDVAGVRVDGERPHSKVWPDFVIEEKYVFYLATQREIRRMQALSGAGKGFDTVLLVPDGAPFTDQVLLGGVTRPELTAAGRESADQRAQYAQRLLEHLTAEEAQQDLARAGLFPVTACSPIYADNEQMAALEESLRGGVTLP